jgi:hypothetical protein
MNRAGIGGLTLAATFARTLLNADASPLGHGACRRRVVSVGHPTIES